MKNQTFNIFLDCQYIFSISKGIVQVTSSSQMLQELKGPLTSFEMYDRLLIFRLILIVVIPFIDIVIVIFLLINTSGLRHLVQRFVIATA